MAGVDALVGDGDLGRAGAFIRELDRLPHSPERDGVLAYHAILRGHAHEAEHLLTRAWADCRALGGAADGDTAAMICHRRALHALAAWDSPALVEWSQRARASHPETSPAVVEARTLEGLGLAGMGRLDDARAAYAAISGQVLEGAQAQRATMGSGGSTWRRTRWPRLPGARAGLPDRGVARLQPGLAVGPRLARPSPVRDGGLDCGDGYRRACPTDP